MPKHLLSRTSGVLLLGLLLIFSIIAWNRDPQGVATQQTASGACLSASDAGFAFDFYGYVHNEDGTTTLSYSVTNPNKKDISYVAFGTGEWARVEPSEGVTTTLTLGTYLVEWTDDRGNPGFTSVKYETQFGGFSKGASEMFTLVVSGFGPDATVQVETKAGKDRGRVSFVLNDPACDKTPAAPTPTPTIIPTRPESPLPTPTIDPSQVLRVLPQRDVTLGPNEEGRTYTGFIPLRIEDEQLIGRGSTGTGESHLVTVDLNTGQVQRLSTVDVSGMEVLYGDLAIQSGYISYPNNASMKVTNIYSGKQEVLPLGVSRHNNMSFQDGLAAWHNYRGNSVEASGIYGYLFEREELFVVHLDGLDQLSLKPHVCNAEWIAYLVAVLDPKFTDIEPKTVDMYQYEVWTFHHPSGDKIYLGMTHDYGSPKEYGPRCDSNHLIWLERAPDMAPSGIYYQLWHFDLTTRGRRMIADDVHGASTEMRMYGDILWNWNTVYDLNTGASIESSGPSTGNNYYKGYLINDAYVRVIRGEPRLAIVQLERKPTVIPQLRFLARWRSSRCNNLQIYSRNLYMSYSC